MSDPAIRVEGLDKRYRLGEQASYRTLRDLLARPFAWLPSQPVRRPEHFWALRDVSFEVGHGEVVGVVGRNGAGKSTLLKILSRITKPTAGRVEIRGRVASLLEVGTGFHPELSGRENIYLNGAILGMRRREIEGKFDEIVAFAEVERFVDTPVKHYSSGMYVRLAFAVAAHLEPEILLVDEVLAVGDVGFQEKCLGKMGSIGRDGRTVVLVSHNMAAVVNLCQRGILLDQGRVVHNGPVKEVATQYIAAVRTTAGEVVWPHRDDAPGNDTVRLHAVRILQPGSMSSTADVDISKEILVEIDYWNLKPSEVLYPAMCLRDHIGTYVLASSNHRSISLTPDPWSRRPHPVGLFRSECRIPGNFLNEGLYSVTAIVGRGVTDTQVLMDYAVSFRVHDTGEMRKEFTGGWIGTVRPRLAWRTEYLEDRQRSADA
jgi:lipopolysaccharide transport system ATP-binding protein